MAQYQEVERGEVRIPYRKYKKKESIGPVIGGALVILFLGIEPWDLFVCHRFNIGLFKISS